MHAVWPIDPGTYERHPVHNTERIWPESNCYVDLWIELLHAAGLDPIAALPFTVTIDLEGDQWTFFKFPLADLYDLYGIDVIELNVWRPLVEHLREQLASGRLAFVEVDANYLPDTIGTSYGTSHVKTSIGVQALDLERCRLGYFHNAGYFELDGPDFGRLFRLDAEQDAAPHLPPYVEVVKLSTRAPLRGRQLVQASRDLLCRHLLRRPQANPFRRYALQLSADLDALGAHSLDRFHSYAFATLRQCGAAFELAGVYFRWLQAHGEGDFESLAAGCDEIATGAKALQFRAARAVNLGRPFDPSSTIGEMAERWESTMADLGARFGTLVHQE